MTRRDDLVRLRDGVKDNLIAPHDLDAFIPALGLDFTTNDAHGAYRGSMNNALSFFETMLPGWEWLACSATPDDVGPCAMVSPGLGDDDEVFEASNDIIARALLLATLDALIAQEDAQDRGMGE